MNYLIVGPKFCTPVKAPCNALARNASDGEVSESESDPYNDLEAESGMKKLNYNGYQYLKWTTQKEWVTGEHTVVGDSDVKSKILKLLKAFMCASLLKKTPGHQLKPDYIIYLWKPRCKEYQKKSDWTNGYAFFDVHQLRDANARPII